MPVGFGGGGGAGGPASIVAGAAVRGGGAGGRAGAGPGRAVTAAGAGSAVGAEEGEAGTAGATGALVAGAGTLADGAAGSGAPTLAGTLTCCSIGFRVWPATTITIGPTTATTVQIATMIQVRRLRSCPGDATFGCGRGGGASVGPAPLTGIVADGSTAGSISAPFDSAHGLGALTRSSIGVLCSSGGSSCASSEASPGVGVMRPKFSRACFRRSAMASGDMYRIIDDTLGILSRVIGIDLPRTGLAHDPWSLVRTE